MKSTIHQYQKNNVSSIGKKIIYTAFAFFALTFATAQTTRDDGDDVDEKLQQQAPRETQTRVENAAQTNNPKTQNNKDLRDAEERIKKEKEKSTGKSSKNPAENNPPVPQPRLTDPVSTPVKNK